MSQVFYYVPEDGDDMETQNCFTIRGISQADLRLSDIHENFPLPGQYHFRFQYLYMGKVTVWLDLSSETAKLPQVDNMIVIKALRLSYFEQRGPPTKLVSAE